MQCLRLVDQDNMKDHFTVFNGFCKHLDLSELLVTLHINFLFAREFQVLIADPGSSPYFMINPETLNGDIIEVNKASHRVYVVDVEEIQWMPDSGECMIYGEEAAFKTYADCVENEQGKTFKPVLGCLPPWLAAPENKDMCKGKVLITKDNLYETKNIINHIKKDQDFNTMPRYKACKKPCTEIIVNSKLIKSQELSIEQGIDLQFKRTVKVRKILFDQRSYACCMKVWKFKVCFEKSRW